jgi:hypothetical protein
MKHLRKRGTVRTSGIPEGWPAGISPIALASQQCTFCHGRGFWYFKRNGQPSVCKCVYRQIFRECLQRYHLIQGRILPQRTNIWAGRNGIHFGFPNAEYCADFVIVSQHRLSEPEKVVFRSHFLEGKDWVASLRDVQRQHPHINKGTYFHCVYSTMTKAGRELITNQPHRLYPLDEYFADRPSISLSSVSKRWMELARQYPYPTVFWKPEPLKLPEPYASRPAIPTPKTKE